LAAQLAIPCLKEEMREHLECTRRPLAGLPATEVAPILLELWRSRAAKEKATSSFVADNTCLDFAAYALFYDCLDGPSLDDPPELLRAPLEHLGEYDAIFLLPCGVLPYVRDGVRPSNQYLQLRYHFIVDGLLRRYADPRKVHYLPERYTDLADRRSWVLSALEKIKRRPRPDASSDRRGIVYLVGAGPGDPSLLTVRARELLRGADVVAHDALVSPAILSLVEPTAELLPVGRRHGTGATSYRLHPAVLACAKAGQTVVRLKAGDPLIFGRGGEEAEELAEAGIPFEIVPGVSAALGAAAYAGIPLTHRLHASDVTFVSGHDVDGSHRSLTEWPRAASGKGTLVIFMAARKLSANLQRLIRSGRSPNTPAAYVASATTADQQVIVGTLATLPEKTRGVDSTAPALVVVGDVVGMRERLAWFERRPLTGRRLLVARARPGRSAIAAELRALGAEVLEVPDVKAVPLNGESNLDAVLARLHAFRGIVFGCAAGVDAMVLRAPSLGVPLIAVGTEAARALARHGIEPAVCVRGACQEALREHSVLLQDGSFLLVTSEDGRPSLSNELKGLGLAIETVAAYRYVRRPPITPLPPLDLVVLPSSSAARAVLSGDLGEELRGVPMVAMGPRTEEAARLCGARSVVRAEQDSSSSLVSLALSTLGAA
jgi:uroporphyrinogen III methyltransferase/synthase